MQCDFENLKDYVINRLDRELPDDLYYHSVEHTLDVLDSALRIGVSEKIDEWQTVVLQAAGVMHDLGFVVGYKEHEKNGCMLAAEIMPRFGYTNQEVEMVCGLIMATKVPQTPVSHLQQILCDADLDYLGRDDFYSIGNKLFEELNSRGVITNQNDWNCLQIKFLSSHRYFTDTNLRDREEYKLGHLNQLKELMLEC